MFVLFCFFFPSPFSFFFVLVILRNPPLYNENWGCHYCKKSVVNVQVFPQSSLVSALNLQMIGLQNIEFSRGGILFNSKPNFVFILFLMQDSLSSFLPLARGTTARNLNFVFLTSTVPLTAKLWIYYRQKSIFTYAVIMGGNYSAYC